MKYGKIYFYDRMGNKVPLDSDPNINKGYKGPFFTSRRGANNSLVEEPIWLDHTYTGGSHIPVDIATGPIDSINSPSPLSFTSDTSINLMAEEPNETQMANGANENAVPKLDQTFLKILENDDDDLCESCRWRDMHLAAVAAQQEQVQKLHKNEQAAIKDYFKRRDDEDVSAREANVSQTKELQNEINAINTRMAEEKRNQRQKSAEGGYLLYNRPDTATVNRQKQRYFHDELTRQVESKKAMEVRERESEMNEGNRQNIVIKSDIDHEQELNRLRDLRKKNEYRRALDAQIAARNVEKTIAENGDLWWTRQNEIKDPKEGQGPLNTKGVIEQTERVQKQANAIRNLEEFINKQREQDDATKETQRSRRQEMNQKQQGLQTPGPSGALQMSRTTPIIDAETQRQVEEAWIKASDDNQKLHFEPLQGTNGSIIDQFNKYRRCRKCQKSIPEKQMLQPENGGEKYYYDMKTGVLRPLEASDIQIWHGNQRLHRH